MSSLLSLHRLVQNSYFNSSLNGKSDYNPGYYQSLENQLKFCKYFSRKNSFGSELNIEWI